MLSERQEPVFYPYTGYRTLLAKARFNPKQYFNEQAVSFGYVIADATYTEARRSHMTTRLIPSQEHTTHDRRILCF